MNKTDDTINGVLALLLIVSICFLALNYIDHRRVIRNIYQDAISHNAAQYNPTNGTFEWKDCSK